MLYVCLQQAYIEPSTKSVVYTVVCTFCEESHKLDPTKEHDGRYVGERARSLFERAGEHQAALKEV